MKKNNNLILSAITGFVLTANSIAAELVGEGPNLKPESRITQQQIESQELSLDEIRQAGLLIFTTPYTKADGYGDGPHDYTQQDQRSPTAGNRPTLQGNGSFLRVNGLDAQTCLECHAIVSNRTIPATLGIGGVGGINTSAIFQPDGIDVGDADFDGVADFNGRLINPPFLFGSGGVELLGLEMTQDLQLLRQKAIENPGQEILLESKGVVFGSIIADTAGALDVSNIKGVDADLVVKPFGRKGETATVRDFDIEAMAFHLGMQANEAFGGEHADADNDGVRNEISEGDLSALSIFLTTMQPPHEHKPKHHKQGKALFHEIGCASCHQPVLETRQKFLPYTMSGNIEQPFANAFYAVDLTQKPMKFKKNK
ncbi:MAG: hypothetical protein KJO88_04140, partial [Gammaproteobacteria bacterium]|nr:hypothetical protein [Gammaproteobacteria bacterium]